MMIGGIRTLQSIVDENVKHAPYGYTLGIDSVFDCIRVWHHGVVVKTITRRDIDNSPNGNFKHLLTELTKTK